MKKDYKKLYKDLVKEYDKLYKSLDAREKIMKVSWSFAPIITLK